MPGRLHDNGKFIAQVTHLGSSGSASHATLRSRARGGNAVGRTPVIPALALDGAGGKNDVIATVRALRHQYLSWV